MISVTVAFLGFESKEEWLSLAQKLYAEKRFVKYIMCETKRKDGQSIEDYIEEVYNAGWRDGIGLLLSIRTKSVKTLKLLKDFIKRNHYESKNHWESNYAIWQDSSEISMSITLGELLEKYSK